MTRDDTGSAPMLGSREPVAWAVYLDGFYGVTVCGSYPREAGAAGHEVVPLYRHTQINPVPLSREEIEALTYAAGTIENESREPEKAAVLWRILHRAAWGD